MKKYLVKRLIQLPIILLGVIAVTFLIVQFTPGDPAVKLAGGNARPEDIEAIREQLGLNKPVLEQFVDYFVNIFHGDFGRSFVRKTEIGGELVTALANTVYLIVFARIWSVIAAIPLGIVAAIKQNTWIDKACMTLTLAGVSIPQFWLGLMLILVFCVKLGVFPIISSGDIRGLILPSITLGAYMMAAVARFTRSSVIETMKEDYIRTARAKGLRERTVIYRHVLKNSMIPVITIVGLNFGVMLGGAVIVESVFGYSGIGMLLVDSINFRDYPMIQMLILIFSLHFVVINLIVDLLYAVVNPEIRLS